MVSLLRQMRSVTPSAALAMDLIWGYTGFLLGHGVFFNSVAM
jgi:hypothetical protein